MSEDALVVHKLGKRYQIGERLKVGRTLREAVVDAASAPFRRLWSAGEAPGQENIWALKDASFKVSHGETVGIIGPNGAGKSTLLKILSRVTEPTEGYARIKGRVGSLLEVGTGFHPELTGRENIFLNSAILGMSRGEIGRKFESIVAFAGVERFLDTPVKRYSSGMSVRLAFSVAAHLEPEILIVDEVLAVGDVEFQKRCLGKMEDLASGGRTVLFVSHNMGAVKSLCERALLLQGGKITCDGEVHQVVNTYLEEGAAEAETGVLPESAHRGGTGQVRVRRVQLVDSEQTSVSRLYLGQPFSVLLTLEALERAADVVVGVTISSMDGVIVTESYSTDGGRSHWAWSQGLYTVRLDLAVTLLPRTYSINTVVHQSNGLDIDLVQSALSFTVLRVARGSDDSFPWPRVRGFVRPEARWQAPAIQELT